MPSCPLIFRDKNTMKKSITFITGWAHGPETMAPLADRLSDAFDTQIATGAQVLRERCIPETDYIVAGSMGGLLSLELLPKNCKKLVLISSTARFCATEDYAFGTPERMLKRMLLLMDRNPQAVLEDFFKNVHAPQRQSRIAIQQQATCWEKALEDSATLAELKIGLEYLLYADLREHIPAISSSTLILHGDQDRIIPVGAAEWLHKNLPNSQLQLFEGFGHALPAHQLQRISRAIYRFLNP